MSSYFGNMTDGNLGMAYDLGVSCFSDLVDLLDKPRVIPCTSEYYEGLDRAVKEQKAERDNLKRTAWFCAGNFSSSPCERKLGLSNGNNLVVLDLDTTAGAQRIIDLVEDNSILAKLHPFSFCVYKTASSTEDNPRVRVVVDANLFSEKTGVERDGDLTAQYRMAVSTVARMLGVPEKGLGRENQNRVILLYWPCIFQDEHPLLNNPMLCSYVHGFAFSRTDIKAVNAEPVRKTHVPVDGALLAAVRSMEGTDHTKVAATLELLSPDGYNNWVEGCMAIHDWSNGSEEGFCMFDAWSSKGSSYDGTGKCREKWDSMKVVPEGASKITMGTLIKKAMDLNPGLLTDEDKYTGPVLASVLRKREAELLHDTTKMVEPAEKVEKVEVVSPVSEPVVDSEDEVDNTGCAVPPLDSMPAVLSNLIRTSKLLDNVPEAVQLTTCLAAVQAVASAFVQVRTIDGLKPVAAVSNWLVCGERGIGKSVASDAAMGVLNSLRKEAYDEYVANEGRREVVERRLRKLRKEQDSADSEDPVLNEQVAMVKDELFKLGMRPSYTYYDITPESAAEEMQAWYKWNNNAFGSVYLYSDDAKDLVPSIMKDKYKDSSDMANMMLNCFTGNQYTRKRVGGRVSGCENAYAHFYASCTFDTFAKFAYCDAADDTGLHRRTHMVKLPPVELLTTEERNERRSAHGYGQVERAAWDDLMTQLVHWREHVQGIFVFNMSEAQRRMVVSSIKPLEKQWATVDAWFNTLVVHTAALAGTLHAMKIKDGKIGQELTDETVQQALDIIHWLADCRVRLIDDKSKATVESLENKLLARVNKYAEVIPGSTVKGTKLRKVYKSMRKSGGKFVTAEEAKSILTDMGKKVVDLAGVWYVLG